LLFLELLNSYLQECSEVGTSGNGVPTPFCIVVTLLEDLDFSFQLLRVANCEN